MPTLFRTAAFLVTLFSGVCLADAATQPVVSDRQALASQRQKFDQAQTLLSKGERPLWLMQQLKTYPLYPYLVYSDLSRRLTSASEVEVAEFLDAYSDSPLSNSLRLQWLKQLASQDRPQAFFKFDKAIKDTSLDCWRLRMRLDGGYPRREVYKDVDKLWLTSQSLPDSCDPLIAQWRRAGNLSDELLWARLELAAQAGNTDLLIYLRSLMPKHEQYMGDLWRAALTSPGTLTSQKYFRGKSPKEREILMFGLKRYARLDSLKAMAMWEKLEHRFRFTEEQKQEVIRALALAMSGGSRPMAEEWLAKIKDPYVTNDVREWRIRFALKNGRWDIVLKNIEAMPAAEREQGAWRYWKARALAAQRDPRAKAMFTTQAKEPNYYGFLANYEIGQKPQLPQAPGPVAKVDRDRIANMKGVLRARELFFLDRLYEARREWAFFQDTLNDKDQVIAAGLAYEWGWYDRPIFTLSKNEHPDALFLRFPLAYERAMVRESKKQAIEPAWAYAITRQESAFMPEARSGAGAIGLMQIMPYTAEHISRKTGMSYKKPDELTIPEFNIRFGTVYLRQMLDNHYGNPILATAAYNAGPGRVKKWLPESEAVPAEVWVETIPYKETRNYVKNVLSFNMIYASRLGQPEHSVLLDLGRYAVQAPGDLAARTTN